MLESMRRVPQIIEVTTDGRSGEQFIADLERQGYRGGYCVKELLRSKAFVASNGQTYRLAVISGNEFEDRKRTNANVRAEAKNRGFLDPPMELAPYLHEMFSDEDLEQMGIWALVFMHEPVVTSDGSLIGLGVVREDDGCCLGAYDGRPDVRWDREVVFLFLTLAATEQQPSR